MKEFETSIKKAEGLSKALKSSMSELGTLTVDPSGKLNRTLDDYSVKTGNATQSTREFFREQRMQDRIFKESVQSITGAVFALSLFTQGSDKAASTTKTVTQSLLAGVGAANAAEFGFYGLGKSLSGLPGIVGRFGSALSGLGGPIGMAVGIGAALITFFQQTNAEAKKAADEGLKDYKKAIEDAASAMDDFLPEVDAAREESLRKSLDRTNRQLEFYRGIHKQTTVEGRMSKIARLAASALPGANIPAPKVKSGEVRGIPQFILSPEEAAELGIDPIELGAMTPAQLKERIDLLAQVQKETNAQLIVLGNTAVGKKRPLRPEDLKSKKLPGPPGLYGPEKPSFIDQEFEAQLRYIEGGQRLFQSFVDKRERMEEKLAEMQEQLNERIAAAREASWQRDVAAVQNLGAIIQSSFNIAGDSLLGKMLKALQVALEIAKAIRAANASSWDTGSTLGFIGSLIPGIGLLLNTRPAGGSSTTDAVNSAYGQSARSSARIVMSGRMDISNGEYFLIQEMPRYNQHLAGKTV